MKNIVSFVMIFSVMLGFIGVARLCYDSKWFVILLFFYSIGGMVTLGMVSVLHTKGGVATLDNRPKGKLQLRPNENEWIVRGKNTPSLDKFV